MKEININDRLYKFPVPIIGLTGGIATGKSTVSRLLIKAGIPLIDADLLVKNIYARQEAKELIQSLAPECLHNGIINFRSLREKFFNSEKLKTKIEEFIYARLEAEFTKAYQALNCPSYVVYDVPLLFETNIHPKVDYSILVYAPREIQLARLIKRDHVSKAQAEVVLNTQMSIEQKKSMVNYLVDNSLDLPHLKKQVEKLVAFLLSSTS